MLYNCILTFCITFIATVIGFFISMPFGLLASHRLFGKKAYISEAVLILIRTMPELLLALFLITLSDKSIVTAIGALSFHSIGMKMFRNGYWQKIVLILSIFLQLCFIVGLLVLILLLDVDDTTYFSLLAVYFVIRCGVCVFIIQTDSAVDYKVAWLVFVGALPLIGETFYLLFAHKLRTKKESNLLHEGHGLSKMSFMQRKRRL